MKDRGPPDAVTALQEAQERHAKLASNMRKLKARHKAALREIAFLRARVAETESDMPLAPILPPLSALDIALQPRNGRATLWKTARERLLWTGLTAEQAFYLECECLHRLACSSPAGAQHFPQLVALEPETLRFEITHQGRTVRELIAQGHCMAFPDLVAQTVHIVDCLRAAGVVHLDMHADGRNLTVTQEGRVSVIDFDLAAVDGVAFSGAVAERLAVFAQEGGYEGFLQRMRTILRQVTP